MERATHGSRRPKRKSVVISTVLAMMITACGGAGGPGATNPGAFQGASSQTCTGVSGVPALYWDYMLGVIRTDYPQTYRFLPYVGPAFIHPQQPLYSFTYPPGWTAEMLTDPSLQLTGANVISPDGQIVWRRLNLTVPGFQTANDFVAQELNMMAENLGAQGPFEVLCTLNAGNPAGESDSAARLVQVGDFTANLNVQVLRTPLLGGSSVAFIQRAVAPTPLFADAAVNVFFPLSGQMLPGGSSAPEDCEDGEDNDTDGLTDFPADPGCDSASDPSEAN